MGADDVLIPYVLGVTYENIGDIVKDLPQSRDQLKPIP